MFLRSLRQPTTPLTRTVILAGLTLLAAPVAHGQGALVAPAGIEVAPASLTLDESASVRRFGRYDAETLIDPAAKGFTPGYTPIMFEGGEGSFPSANGWDVFDDDDANGQDVWLPVGCRPNSGEGSIWAGDITELCGEYDNDMESWMIFGPFSLRDATEARVEFFAWSDVEDLDTLFVGASTDGNRYFGATIGSDFDWSRFEYDFNSSQLGQQNVWLAFVFESDSVGTREGVYLDDIVLEKLVGSGVGCVANQETACRLDGRFEVTATYETAEGDMGPAKVVTGGTDEAFNMYFSRETNWELTVKLLDGCAVNNHYWVFIGGTTNLGIEVRVRDTMTDVTKVYENPVNQNFLTVADSSAFATCP